VTVVGGRDAPGASIRSSYRRASTVGWGLLVGLLLTALCFGAASWVARTEPRSVSIIDLEFAGSSQFAEALLQEKASEETTRTVPPLLAGITRDWWFIAAYVATICWWCMYGWQHFRMPYWRRLARLLAWAVVVAGIADVFENLWLMKLLHARGDDDVAAKWATAATIPKWLVLACTVPVCFAALLTGIGRNSRRWFRRAPVFEPSEPAADEGDPRQRWRRPADVNRCTWNAMVPSFREPQAPGEQRVTQRREPSNEPWEGRIGMCFSGGGIRSATFNMGSLQVVSSTQAPQELRGNEPKTTVLQRTDFLSCVSGGAYIAGALQILSHDTPDDKGPPTFQQCSAEEHHVRLHGRYIADTLGEWCGALARVVSGTVMNLVVFALVLFVLARPVGWIQHDFLFHIKGGVEEALKTTDAMWFAVGWTAGTGLLVLLIGTVLGGADGAARSRVQTVAFGFLGLAGGVLLVVWLLPTLARLVPQWVEYAGGLLPWAEKDRNEAGGTLVVLTASGSLTMSALAIINRSTPPPEKAKGPRWPALKFIKQNVGLALPYVAGILLGVIALVVYAMFTAQAAGAGLRGRGSFFAIDHGLEGPVWAGAVVLVTAIYLGADQTRWCLGPFYRRRLASAFAIRKSGELAEELPWKTPTTLSDYGKRHPGLPELLVCAAANLSAQTDSPPGRRAASFVFGADVVGGPEVGWARTKDLEAVCSGPTASDCTLLGAIAISGAAFASAMGRQSRGAINSLLAASNARLGVWLPNPRYIAELRRQEPEPQYITVATTYEGPWVKRRRFPYLFKELFGTYSLEDRFVYLTDGGHYENLGLVELLRRKCQVIVCFDASGDDLITCGTFVEALALAEEELGAKVKIDLSPLAPRKAASPTPGVLTALDGRLSERSVVSGTISYGDGWTGRLVLAKASLTKETPAGVLAHAARQKKATFPNDSTGDQFFDESQFNAYSELGRHIATEAVRELNRVLALH